MYTASGCRQRRSWGRRTAGCLCFLVFLVAPRRNPRHDRCTVCTAGFLHQRASEAESPERQRGRGKRLRREVDGCSTNTSASSSSPRLSVVVFSKLVFCPPPPQTKTNTAVWCRCCGLFEIEINHRFFLVATLSVNFSLLEMGWQCLPASVLIWTLSLLTSLILRSLRRQNSLIELARVASDVNEYCKISFFFVAVVKRVCQRHVVVRSPQPTRQTTLLRVVQRRDPQAEINFCVEVGQSLRIGGVDYMDYSVAGCRRKLFYRCCAGSC